MKRIITGNSLTIADNDNNSILKMTITVTDRQAHILVTGNLTHNAAPDFEDELMSILLAGYAVQVDLSSLEHISAPGLKALLTAQKLVDEKKCSFHIRGVSQPVQEIFANTGFIDLLDIRD